MQILDKQEGNAAEMIAMKMAEKNGIDPRRIEPRPFHRQQRGRSAVQKENATGSFDEITALIASAATERIAAAQNVKFHAGSAKSLLLVTYHLEVPAAN